SAFGEMDELRLSNIARTHFDTIISGPDLAATSLAWNTAQGGVDFGYTISGADLPKATTAALYWSTDTTFDSIQDTLIPGSVTTTQTAARTDPYPVHIDASTLGSPPTEAKYLLAVVDPDNTIAELDEPNYPNDFGSNNVRPLQLSDIQMLAATATD